MDKLRLFQSDIEIYDGPTKPFLRWAGGKIWLSKRLTQIFGTIQFERYHEPFLGGGSIFFSLPTLEKSYLSDTNHALIETFNCLKDNPSEIIKHLKEFSNDEESYYRIRRLVFDSPYARSAQFIYLNQTSYNGIYRVNLNGVYNVPYGYRTKNFLEEDVLHAASAALQNSVIFWGDFDDSKDNIEMGDLVFIDPPYTVSHNKNGFIKYNKSLFSLEDQYRLASYVEHIKGVGAKYILTNAAHSTIREIFSKGDQVIEVERASLIGGKKAKRGQISELLFTNLEANL